MYAAFDHLFSLLLPYQATMKKCIQIETLVHSIIHHSFLFCVLIALNISCPEAVFLPQLLTTIGRETKLTSDQCLGNFIPLCIYRQLLSLGTVCFLQSCLKSMALYIQTKLAFQCSQSETNLTLETPGLCLWLNRALCVPIRTDHISHSYHLD